MRMHFITFRSVTPAQRAQRVLRDGGLTCTLQRTPRPMQDRGCGYCLRLRPWDTPAAVELLQKNNVPFSKVYATDNGQIDEVVL